MKSINPRGSQKSSKAAEEDALLPAVSISIVACIVALATVIAFIPSLRNEFVNWDDYETLVNHSRYRGLGWPQLRWMFTTFYMGHFQPLSWLSFALDYSVWGTHPVGYHLTNIILHAANAVLFFFLACLLLSLIHISGQKDRFGLTLGAALAALIFSLHPLRVESVAWATERRDVLSGLFYLLALYSYLTAQAAAEKESRRRRLGASLFVYALSLLSKGTAMTLPAVLILLDVYPLRRLPGTPSSWLKPNYRHVLSEKLPFIVLAMAFALVAILAQQDTGALRPVQQYFVSYRLGQAFYAIGFYLWKTLIPVNLSPLYELPYDFDTWMPLFIVCGVATTIATAVLYGLRFRWPAVFAAWVYYLVVLAPVAGIAQSGPQLVADRYSYLSCLSWALLLGGGVGRLWISFGQSAGREPRTIASFAAAILVLITLGALSWQQNKIWRDTKTLWQHVIAVAPDSSIAQYNLARFYEDQAKFAVSLEHYRRAVQINPTHADAQYNLARLLARLGMVTEASARYRQVLKIRPADPDAHNNLALLLARRGETEGALAEFRKAVEIDPNYGKAFFNMGKLLADSGELEKSIHNYREALRLNPDETEILLGLAAALARQRQYDEAVIHLRAAVALKPQLPDAHVALARTLAAQGNKEEAEKHYQQALLLLKTPPSLPQPDRGALP